MKFPIVKTGKSKGLRRSKPFLNKYHIKDSVYLILEKGQIVIKPLYQPRKGWEKAFKAMNENGDDRLLLDHVFEDEQFMEWK